MIDCVLISAGTVFAVLGILRVIRRIHQAIFIDRVPKCELELAKYDLARLERWYKDRGDTIDKFCGELESLKTKKRKVS